MKRVTVIVLALVMVLAMVPTVALAADTEVNDAASLQAALNVGGDIKLTANIDRGSFGGSGFTVAGGVVATLDLNGFTLQGVCNAAANTELIRNQGTLTIKDTSASQTGKMVFSSSVQNGWGNYSAVIANLGTLTIDSGTLQNLGGTDMAYVVDNLSGGSAAVLTVNGGILRCENYIAVRAFANSTTKMNRITVAGGIIYGAARGIWIQQPSSQNGLAELIISGGRVEGGSQAAVDVYLLGADGVDVTISGGVLVNSSNTRATLSIRGTGSGALVTVSGGQFSNNGTAGNFANYNTDDTTTVIQVTAGVFSVPVPQAYIASGAEPSQIIIVATGSTEVTAGVDPTYTIVIPAAVNFGTLQKDTGTRTQNFPVTAQNVLIENGKAIIVSVNSNFKMASGGTLLGYLLKKFGGGVMASGGEFARFSADGESIGSVEVDTDLIVQAGSYQGTMTFTIAYQ